MKLEREYMYATRREKKKGNVKKSKEEDIGDRAKLQYLDFKARSCGVFRYDSGIRQTQKAIYDGGDAHKFIRALEKKIKHYDRDIEKLCSHHYNSFVEAVQELLDLRSQCDNIKQNVVEVDAYLKENSKSLMEKAQQIVKMRRTQRNIAAAIDSVSLCLPVLEKYTKLQEQIEQKKYYPALKTLEQLEHTYLPRVERYRFAKNVSQNVQIYRDRIKEASFSDFTDFLENIRNVTAKIGQIALKHEFSAQDIVDFSPVYKCCLIFNVLNDKDSFENYYRKQRREQALLLFFVVEDHIMTTASGLVTRAYRDELWEIAANYVEKTLNNHFVIKDCPIDDSSAVRNKIWSKYD
uniref:Exocyst complex component 6 n=1 Tax=Romanomermis culicivorax TaxID=13658 RepID=A0A915JCW0_ROMCU